MTFIVYATCNVRRQQMTSMETSDGLVHAAKHNYTSSIRLSLTQKSIDHFTHDRSQEKLYSKPNQKAPGIILSHLLCKNTNMPNSTCYSNIAVDGSVIEYVDNNLIPPPQNPSHVNKISDTGQTINQPPLDTKRMQYLQRI
jgi:hypothetical protein